MCLACVEAELWAAYQADLAARAGAGQQSPLQPGSTKTNHDDATAQAGPVSGPGTAASECECK
jgi:hypothetical protein